MNIFSKWGWDGPISPAPAAFAANAISGLILAMHMVSLDSKTSSHDHIMAFESEQRIPNAVEQACGAMKFARPSAAMQLEMKNRKSQCSVCAFFACALCTYLFLYVAQMNERMLVSVCSADMAAL